MSVNKAAEEQSMLNDLIIAAEAKTITRELDPQQKTGHYNPAVICESIDNVCRLVEKKPERQTTKAYTRKGVNCYDQFRLS